MGGTFTASRLRMHAHRVDVRAAPQQIFHVLTFRGFLMIVFLKRSAASVPTPATDKVTMFVEDSTGEPSYKDDTGTVTSLKGVAGAAGQGVPTGGTAGQVLRKIDGTDYNTEWATSGAAEDRNTVSSLSTSGSVDIDYALGDYFTLALAGNVSGFTFSNMPGSGKGATLMIRITQDTTPRTVAWPASFKWAGASAGAVSTASGAVDVLAITTFDNGTTWEATLAKAFA